MYIYIYTYIYIYAYIYIYIAYQIDMFRTWLYEYVLVMLFRNKHKALQSVCKTTIEYLPQVPKVNTTDPKSK